MKQLMSLFAGAAVSVCALSSASASPLIYLAIEGRIQGSSLPFSSSVQVRPGDHVDYQIVLQFAPVGTVNVQPVGSVPRTTTTLQSLNFDPVAARGDGVNSLFLDIYQNPTDPIQTNVGLPTLNADPSIAPNDSWAAGLGASGSRSTRTGSTGMYDVIGIRPIHAAGVFTGVLREIVASGVFDVPTTASIDQISVLRVRPTSSANGDRVIVASGRINSVPKADGTFPGTFEPLGATTAGEKTGNIGTENRPDPMIGFGYPPVMAVTQSADIAMFATAAATTGGLQISAAVPEPSSALLACACIGTLAFRRRRSIRSLV